jgi:hypothetical protein
MEKFVSGIRDKHLGYATLPALLGRQLGPTNQRNYHKQSWGFGSALILEVGSGSAIERKARFRFGSAIKPKFRSCRAIDAHNGGLEAQNGALEGP